MSRALTPALRAKVEAAVDRLLALLDAMDDDPDLEPSLAGLNCSPGLGGWHDDRNSDQTGWSVGGCLDQEEEHDGREPSLCGLTVHTFGDDGDLEEEHDGQEPLHVPARLDVFPDGPFVGVRRHD